jgi:hypothetical protein
MLVPVTNYIKYSKYLRIKDLWKYSFYMFPGMILIRNSFSPANSEETAATKSTKDTKSTKAAKVVKNELEEETAGLR